MTKRAHKAILTIFVALLLLLVTAVFFHSPGTSDVSIWERWAMNARLQGPVRGFIANGADYPPLSSLILLGAAEFWRATGLPLIESIKLSITLFLVLTALVFWLWTKDIVAVTALYLALLLNTVALAYIDIYIAPTLVAAFWALKERKLALSSALFTVTVLVKWQPLIIAPFLGIYVLHLLRGEHWWRIDLKRLALRVLLPALAVGGLVLAAYGLQPLTNALQAALNHTFLSGNALNLSWIITHRLHVLRPFEFGGLVDGQAAYIVTDDPAITRLPRMLFLASYAVTFVVYALREKSFKNLILFSLLGYLVYFTFNTGVHENHLFLASILAVVLWWESREHTLSMITIVLMSNINLFLFYGVEGAGPRFNRAILAKADTALWLAVFNVAFVAYFWAVSLLRSERAPATEPHPK